MSSDQARLRLKKVVSVESAAALSGTERADECEGGRTGSIDGISLGKVDKSVAAEETCGSRGARARHRHLVSDR